VGLGERSQAKISVRTDEASLLIGDKRCCSRVACMLSASIDAFELRYRLKTSTNASLSSHKWNAGDPFEIPLGVLKSHTVDSFIVR